MDYLSPLQAYSREIDRSHDHDAAFRAAYRQSPQTSHSAAVADAHSAAVAWADSNTDADATIREQIYTRAADARNDHNTATLATLRAQRQN